jgi:hypothetical protein
MKPERGNIRNPMWRKKVDVSIFRHNGTTIPDSYCKAWLLDRDFSVLGGKVEKNKISITFDGQKYDGWITSTHPQKRKAKVYRLFFEEALTDKLKEAFVMSFMRDLEARLRPHTDIEKEMQFWEFLDIEYDAESRTCRMTAFYNIAATFPSLFRYLARSPPIRRLEDEVLGKGGVRIHKGEWRKRDLLQTEIGATNVLYFLADTKNKLLYVGEAEDLVKRLRGDSHPTIKEWNYYRYNSLPSWSEDIRKEIRLAIERMTITDMASLLETGKGTNSLRISQYHLANERID